LQHPKILKGYAIISRSHQYSSDHYLVIKIDANHGDDGEARKSPFIGREKEVNEIIESLKSKKGMAQI
jgi:hypothetical protein